MSASTSALALDCTLTGFTLALQNGAGEVTTHTEATPRASDALHVTLQEIMQKQQLEAKSLAHFIAATGPGSFTGIRLALAVGQALKLVNPALTLIGLPTFTILAHHVMAENQPQQPFTLLLDAAGQTVYKQTFNPDATPHSPAECLPNTADFGPYPLVAPATLLLPRAADVLLTTPNPALMLQLAANPLNHAPFAPIYLKELNYQPQ